MKYSWAICDEVPWNGIKQKYDMHQPQRVEDGHGQYFKQEILHGLVCDTSISLLITFGSEIWFDADNIQFLTFLFNATFAKENIWQN